MEHPMVLTVVRGFVAALAIGFVLWMTALAAGLLSITVASPARGLMRVRRHRRVLSATRDEFNEHGLRQAEHNGERFLWGPDGRPLVRAERMWVTVNRSGTASFRNAAGRRPRWWEARKLPKDRDPDSFVPNWYREYAPHAETPRERALAEARAKANADQIEARTAHLVEQGIPYFDALSKAESEAATARVRWGDSVRID